MYENVGDGRGLPVRVAPIDMLQNSTSLQYKAFQTPNDIDLYFSLRAGYRFYCEGERTPSVNIFSLYEPQRQTIPPGMPN